MKPLHHFSLFICICFTLGVSAQEGELERSFRVLGFGDGYFEGLTFELESADGVKTLPLEFLPNRKSRTQKVSAEQSRLKFYYEAIDSQGNSVAKALDVVDWPDSAEKLLIVFLQLDVGGNEPVYDILVFDESPSVWGPRCARFLNLSGARLDVKIRDFAFPLEEGPSDILCFEGEYSIPMTLELSLPWDGKRETVYSARFFADQYSPKLLVVRPPVVEGSLRVEVITIW